MRPERKGKNDFRITVARTPHSWGVFHARISDHFPQVTIVEKVSTEILGADDISRAITRIAHEVIERNSSLAEIVVVGMQTGGTWIASRLCESIERLQPGSQVPLGAVDISMYRDDFSLRPVVLSAPTDIPVDLTGRTVVLVDDVLFTGRTVRAALEALNDHGRPRAVQLAVMVDRGHRELPIRPDYVGKNIPTHISDEVQVGPEGVTVTTSQQATS